MRLLSQIWKKWQAVGRSIGDFVGRLVMTVFFFTIALPFGLAVRYLNDPLRLKQGEPRWDQRETESPTLEGAGRAY